jgi:regulation of enolase protein 1 (concanavalin A-like superfamily)
MGAMRVPPLPMALRWLSEPEGFEHSEGTVRIVAGPGTDWFTDPGGRPPSLNAPALAGPHDGPFCLGARVTVAFGSTFDAGGLVVYGNERVWAKLCLERSPQGEATVVSVVTRGQSDDCTAESIDGNSLWLRAARLGPDFVFHVSADGERWRFVRHFALDGAETSLIGFEAQSPTGPGCAVSFDDISFGIDPPAAMRDGS